nr:MAG TPA_asm: hypothetical protein [Caudoviricetes sp.]
MERLTKYSKETSHENGICCTHFFGPECLGVVGNCAMNCKWEEAAWSRLAAYEDTGLTPEEVNDAVVGSKLLAKSKLVSAFGVAAERLLELAEADKDGRVVVLPCKVGDRLYEVTGRKTISVYKVKAIRVELFGLFIEWDIVEGFVWQSLSGINAGEIGKTVFLTHEEAKKALEGKRNA